MLEARGRGCTNTIESRSFYRYDHQGFLIDRVTHNPDNSILNIEDA